MQTLSKALMDSFARNEPSRAITFFRNREKETELSFGRLDQESGRLAGTLAGMGLQKGDRVVFNLPKSLFFVVAYLAVQRLGGVVVPINPELTRSEKEYLFQDARPGLIITKSEEQDLIREIGPEYRQLAVDAERPFQDLPLVRNADKAPQALESAGAGPDDPALIIYTSGTTGLPKGAVLTQFNLLHDAQNVIKTWEISAEDRLLHALPLFHVHGLCFALNTCLLTGAGVVMLDRFSPETVLEFLAGRKKEKCTLFMAVPAMYQRLLSALHEEKEAFEHVRLWTSGSAPLDPLLFERIRDGFGKTPLEREGMSETGMNFSNPLHGPRKPGSIGLPLPGVRVRIVDPERFIDQQPGRVGEIWLKSPSISPGYWNKPDETGRVFHQGWFRTGDLGFADQDGYYFLTDRLKHIIISGGENVSPKEVENRLNRIEGVLE
ncbi:MAG: class I adenylate-forming enzyme family protein, partial [Thermodesulfobacteriota bacterium]